MSNIRFKISLCRPLRILTNLQQFNWLYDATADNNDDNEDIDFFCLYCILILFSSVDITTFCYDRQVRNSTVLLTQLMARQTRSQEFDEDLTFVLDAHLCKTSSTRMTTRLTSKCRHRHRSRQQTTNNSRNGPSTTSGL